MSAPFKVISAISILFVLTVLSLLFIRMTVQPPGNTRVILDHSLQKIIAPPCFNSAEVTNNLTESKLSRADKLQFKPDSACTEKSLAGTKMTLFQILLEKIGVKKGGWDW
ncbi:hypothetical protein J23TS9_12660 [Paenibacillus sp. J23TS9]|uniref:hypothetical protein n=1 Tax=Paenibacillus sp. J23TS9 TaxID=2807193 RepID=UPI001B2D67DC|nr:hypothetical protein [Paenibacillus sp. J23TS9]GIP26136.1 hypothetical protein J23TS9_12660 [Paenibacillus sp. J23TS9]